MAGGALFASGGLTAANLRQPNFFGNTALHIAAKKGHAKVCNTVNPKINIRAEAKHRA